MRLGHPPGVVDILCPPLARRIGWGLRGTLSRTALALDGRPGGILGSVQFLRSRRDRGTWMFGHWRVAAGRRREGIGRRLLREGAGLLPDGTRLYSYVDWGNEASLAAHERCGFEAGRTLHGSAPLSVLTTIGAATPALRLEPAGWRNPSLLFGLYARSMGSLWFRLFPGLRPRRFLAPRIASFRVVLLAMARDAERAGGPAGLVVWEGESPSSPIRRPATRPSWPEWRCSSPPWAPGARPPSIFAVFPGRFSPAPARSPCRCSWECRTRRRSGGSDDRESFRRPRAPRLSGAVRPRRSLPWPPCAPR